MPLGLQRYRGIAGFALLAAVAELLGRSFTKRLDRRLHVAPLAPSHATYYPFLLVGVKIVGALALAALLARLVRARGTADAGERLLEAVGHLGDRRVPKLRLILSGRVWLASFATTSTVFLAQTNGEQMWQHRLPSLAPWLHTYALPVFAMLSVLVALAWGLRRWLHDVEAYASHTLDRVRRILSTKLTRESSHPRPADDLEPRRRFGLALDSRPPPLLVA